MGQTRFDSRFVSRTVEGRRLNNVVTVKEDVLPAVPLDFQEAVIGRAARLEDGQIYQQPGRRILQAVKGLGVTVPGWFRDAVLPLYGRKGVERAGNGRKYGLHGRVLHQSEAINVGIAVCAPRGVAAAEPGGAHGGQVV